MTCRSFDAVITALSHRVEIERTLIVFFIWHREYLSKRGPGDGPCVALEAEVVGWLVVTLLILTGLAWGLW